MFLIRSVVTIQQCSILSAVRLPHRLHYSQYFKLFCSLKIFLHAPNPSQALNNFMCGVCVTKDKNGLSNPKMYQLFLTHIKKISQGIFDLQNKNTPSPDFKPVYTYLTIVTMQSSSFHHLLRSLHLFSGGFQENLAPRK